MDTKKEQFKNIPSVDEILRSPECVAITKKYGRIFVVSSIRSILSSQKATVLEGGNVESFDIIVRKVKEHFSKFFIPDTRRVLNLSGTVIHTNLGRSLLAKQAIENIRMVSANHATLEFDIDKQSRGDRDNLVSKMLEELTGAEAATVVNNNAAAVYLVLSTFGFKKEVIVSRGELVEIGGSFRIPEIMERAGSKLKEVGTTNRTHFADYESAISGKTGLILKVHTSNYEVKGFTANVCERELAHLCKRANLPLTVDLGSGNLINMESYGLPKEPTVKSIVNSGADLVTFSGDKLLGGPQCGIIVGSKTLISKIKENPVKRILRVDKTTMAALSSTLFLYGDPSSLSQNLPTLGFLSRKKSEIKKMADKILPKVKDCLRHEAEVRVIDCFSQVGSGALPISTLPSVGLSIAPIKKGSKNLRVIQRKFLRLPIPIIGRIHDNSLILDVRCLLDESDIIQSLGLWEEV